MTIETAETTQSASSSSTETTQAAATPAKADLSAASTETEDELLSRVYDEASEEDESAAGDDDAQKVAKADGGGAPERDASGKFVSKNPELKADKEAAPDKVVAKEPADKKAASTEKAPADTKADQSKVDYSGHQRGWSEEDKAEFAKLSPEAQKFVVARQSAQLGALTKAQQDLADLRKSADPLVTLVNEHAEYFDELSAAFKSTPADIIKGILSTEQALRHGTFKQKQAVLMGMARDYGVPLQLMEPDDQADPSLPTSEHHPMVHDLQQQNARLQARLDAIERNTQTTASANLERSVAEFAATVDEGGQPKYPHFEIVRASMGQILADGKASTLPEAYELAVKPLIEAAKREATASRQAEEARTAAEKAKRAGAVNVSTAAKAVQRFASEDDMLADVFDRASAA
jgi:hypothetical protein